MKFSLLLFLFFPFSFIFSQWVPKLTVQNSVLSSLHFPSPEVGYVVDNIGTIYKSSNAGENWNVIYSNPNIELKTVFFINETIGFAAGSVLLKTIDGGNSWNVINTSSTGIIKIQFLNSQLGFFCGDNGLYKTIDGGNNWSQKSTFYVKSMSFPTPNVGYFHENVNSLYKTIDGGETWNLLANNANPISTSLVSTLFFINESKGFFGGYYYNAFTKTLDGGTNWDCVFSNCNIDFTGVGIKSIHFPTSNVGYATCNGGNNINILKTIDGGETWLPQNGDELFTELFFTSENTGYAISVNSLYKTNNGGSLNSQSFNSTKVKLYPNPTSSKLFIETEANINFPIRFELYSILGRKLMSMDLDSSLYGIDLNEFSAGTYVYKLYNLDINTTGKFIKN